MRSNAIPELIAIGESMVLVTPTEAVPLETAADFHLATGGAESNVALHFVALGHTASWVSQLGDDALGRRVSGQISDGGVDTRWTWIHPSAPTGVYFKDPGRGVQYFRTGSAASHMGPEILEGIALERAAVVHVSGITPALSASCNALVHSVVERVRASPAILSFDINHRAGLWGGRDAGAELRELAARSDIVFVGLDEAQALWGTLTPQDVRDFLPEPEVLVVKDGDVGATEFHAGQCCFVPAIPTRVVEAVGAGDAFAAGYLSAHVRGLGSAQKLRAGHQQAVLVLQSTSDVPRHTPFPPSIERTSHAHQ
ncbi:sugar kinase [Specibacter sp. RAF43]|uniref:sugar kinase n=1 Tax=Specibacter sp. RAF43 TaxID=3233057 RepID=UPI003F98E9F2